ncbi:hypothetical protein [Aquimarina agarilytica]|uniref:hypothetical protein n=1 Tax=Aquimarina agarilytica TaxID=1087449 RepID=UPI00028983B7|nr:hypothetical protein [Aquimarina agarilytica]
MDMNKEQLNVFLEMSTVLTAFSEYELKGTGQLEAYFNTVVEIVGQGIMDELLNAFAEVKKIANNNEAILNKQLRFQLLSNDKLGPITRNIIKMWFIGSWYQLPNAWRENYGESQKDITFVVSANSFIEGLLWPSIDSHPPGAKAPGYGTWTNKPQITEL